MKDQIPFLLHCHSVSWDFHSFYCFWPASWITEVVPVFLMTSKSISPSPYRMWIHEEINFSRKPMDFANFWDFFNYICFQGRSRFLHFANILHATTVPRLVIGRVLRRLRHLLQANCILVGRMMKFSVFKRLELKKNTQDHVFILRGKLEIFNTMNTLLDDRQQLVSNGYIT